MALQGGHRFAVSMADVFPYGVYAMSVEQAQDYDEKSGRRTPSKDKQTGELVWTVTVIDRDPEAREKQVKVKVSGAGAAGAAGGDHARVGSARGGLHRRDDHAVRVRGPWRWPGPVGVLAAGDPGCTRRARPPPARLPVVSAGWRPALPPAPPTTARPPSATAGASAVRAAVRRSSSTRLPHGSSASRSLCCLTRRVPPARLVLGPGRCTCEPLGVPRCPTSVERRPEPLPRSL